MRSTNIVQDKVRRGRRLIGQRRIAEDHARHPLDPASRNQNIRFVYQNLIGGIVGAIFPLFGSWQGHPNKVRAFFFFVSRVGVRLKRRGLISAQCEKMATVQVTGVRFRADPENFHVYDFTRQPRVNYAVARPVWSYAAPLAAYALFKEISTSKPRYSEIPKTFGIALARVRLGSLAFLATKLIFVPVGLCHRHRPGSFVRGRCQELSSCHCPQVHQECAFLFGCCVPRLRVTLAPSGSSAGALQKYHKTDSRFRTVVLNHRSTYSTRLLYHSSILLVDSLVEVGTFLYKRFFAKPTEKQPTFDAVRPLCSSSFASNF